MPRRLFLLPALFALSLVALACGGPEKVIPFPDAGPACGTVGHVDCARYPNLTCTATADAAPCGKIVWGCADAASFVAADRAGCEGDAGDANEASDQ